MADRTRKGDQPDREDRIRSMQDAVSELRRSMGDAPTDAPRRVYGESENTAGKEGPQPAHAPRHAAAAAPVRRKKKKAGGQKLHPHGSRERFDRIFHFDRKKNPVLFGRTLRFWPSFLVAFVLMLVMVFLANTTELTVDREEITLVGLPTEMEGMRFLVLSDLNGRRFGDTQSTLMRTINTLSYDAVLCLGDMVGRGGDPEPFYELLDALPRSKQVYFVAGDSDPGPLTETDRGEEGTLEEHVLADWILGAVDRGAIYVDRPVRITSGSAHLWLVPWDALNVEVSENNSRWKEQVAQEEDGYLAGIEADRGNLALSSYRYQAAQNLLQAYTQISASDPMIVLSHVPLGDGFLTAACSHAVGSGKYLPEPDLSFAGHYCGGIFRLPGIGAVYVPDSSLARYGWFPEQERAGGQRTVDTVTCYTTRGLSTCGELPLLKWRLLNNPQIGVVTLTATLPTSMLDRE